MEPKLMFNIRNQHMVRTDTFQPVQKSRNYLYAEFDFKTNEWKEKIKTAVFSAYGRGPFTVILEQDRCLVPWEVLECDKFEVSVFAGDRITTGKVTVQLKESGYTEGKTPEEPTPSVYDKIMEILEGKADDIKYNGNILRLLSGDKELARTMISGGSGGGGSDAREIELQNDGTYIRWRYVGDSAWMNLVALQELTGTPGNDGIPGVDGKDGAPGADGADGKTPVKGVDYFTQEDIEGIKSDLQEYIDAEIGGVLNGSY